LLKDSVMTAYEFYWRDESGKEHLFGILPERRKLDDRITVDSIINWGRSVISSIADPEQMFFVPVKIE
jgi:hypothetical protein